MKFNSRIFIFLICLITVMFPVFSQSAGVTTQIDQAIEQKDAKAVSSILEKNVSSKSYGDYESYVLRKARSLLVSNDLDLALALSLAVIDNNIDNFDAVALYTSIDHAVQEREAKKKADEEKRQIEEMKMMANSAKEQKQIKKQYQSISNTSSGETVYLDIDYNTHYLPISWAVNLGMADLSLYMDDKALLGKFGFSTSGNVFYHNENFSIGGDFFADAMLFTFGNAITEGEEELDSTIKASLAFAHDKILRNLYFRLGVLANISNNAEKSYIPATFVSPSIGLAYRDMALGPILAEVSLDYQAGHFFHENMKFAMDFTFNFVFPMVDLDTVDVALNFGLRDGIYVMDKGTQNQAKFLISIGVCSND